MSTSSWSTPDPRRPVAAPPAFATTAGPPAEAVEPVEVAAEVRDAALTSAVLVLLGAPVGLLWGLLAPRVDVVVSGEDVNLAVPGSSAFIAADGYFLAAVVLAGVVSGVAAWLLARRRGPGVVVGLAVGGVVAAYVAMVVGQQVGFAEVRAAVESGQQGALQLNLRLRAREALVGWPVGALVAFVGSALVRLGPSARDEAR